MSVNEAPVPVALLARPGQARERLRQALEAAGAQVVLEDDPNAMDAGALTAASPRAVLIALEPAVEDALEALEAVLQSSGLPVIFDEADLAANRDGWEAQRWIRHLAAKLHGHGDVLPPGAEREHDLSMDLEPGHPQTPEQEHADARFEPHLVEAEALAGGLPQDRPGAAPPPAPAFTLALEEDAVQLVARQPAPTGDAGMAPVDDAGGIGAPAGPATPPPLPDFSRLELVELEPMAPAGTEEAPAGGRVDGRVDGVVLVVAGIGGPDAVRKLLVALPKTFSHPVLVQLRLDGGRYDNLVKQLSRVATLPVQMAAPEQFLAGGRVYVLPDGLSMEKGNDGLRFAQSADQELIELLPSEQSAVLMLSGADPQRVAPAIALAERGALVSGQAVEGCYDAAAVKLLAEAGMELGAPAQLAERLAARWG